MKIPNQSSMEVFVSLCMDQLENVESIKSEKGVFVEIVTSEYKDLKPGSVMHIKLADKQVNMIEKGMRKTKEEELKRGNLVPAVHVTINVYTETEKGNLLALSGLKLKWIEKRSASAVNASFLYLFPFFLRITLSIDTSDRKIQSFHIHLR